MTASPGRRRRSTSSPPCRRRSSRWPPPGWPSLGGVTLYNSTEGAERHVGRRRAGVPGDADRRRSPRSTTTASWPRWRCSSCSRPATGGSIVTSRSAPTPRRRRRRAPAARRDVRRCDGADALAERARGRPRLASTTSRSSTRPQLAELLEPLGALDGRPARRRDRRRRATSSPTPARSTLEPAEAAAILTARDPAVPARRPVPGGRAPCGRRSPRRSATAGAAGDRRRRRRPPAVGGPSTTVVARARRGPVGHRGPLTRASPSRGREPTGVDVVRSTAPSWRSSSARSPRRRWRRPNPALTFRIVSPFSDEQLAAAG